MKKGQKFVIFFFLLLAVSLIVFFYKNFNEKSGETELQNPITDDNRDYISRDEENKTDNKYEPTDLIIAGNLVWWDQTNGLTQIQDNSDIFDIVSPYWYSFNEHGNIKKTSYAEDITVTNSLKENNLLIVPTFTNGHTTEISRSIFNDNSKKLQAIQNIISTIQTNGFDGAQLDFENMEEEDKEDFTNFVRELSERLNEIDKLLIITVQAKTNDAGTSKTNKAQNWSDLANYSDYIYIMAYDYHWSTSTPGEIAPVSWVREVLDYAVKEIPKEKILLGVNFYGYDWVGSKASALEYSDVVLLINKYGINPTMTLEKEKHFEYTENGVEHSAYYADSETLEEKIKIILDYEIAGLSIWRLGNEDSNNFSMLRKYGK